MATSTQVPIKSILKSATTSLDNQQNDKTRAQKDRENLTIALKHAHLIQHQKNLQALILSAIETLLDFPPLNSTTTPTSPPPTPPQTQLLNLLSPFQPSDLDDLVTERRIDGKCGYALCPNPPRSSTAPSWKLKPNTAINPSDYCSKPCQFRTQHIRDQLSPIPAWERDPSQPPIRIRLLDEPEEPTNPTKPVATATEAHHDGSGPHKILAAERADNPTSTRPARVLSPFIVEKAPKPFVPKVSSLGSAKVSSTAIEGYEPRRRLGEERSSVGSGRGGVGRGKRKPKDGFGKVEGAGRDGDADGLDDLKRFDDVDDRGVGAIMYGMDGEVVKEVWHGEAGSSGDADEEQEEEKGEGQKEKKVNDG
ncbi:hypothetical protein B0A50_02257 [Salinomyces thailandicus]|uniref:RNA polymerase II subunit B1 CTD phosphatase RPAP2 homolog n=1 Tax=Salinomyces thailandicus TaxID=706561 RepID=A0A4U0U813_9PEZI|nr:hypothetical protein B0A50_02257 [Salinomyces thailandica]